MGILLALSKGRQRGRRYLFITVSWINSVADPDQAFGGGSVK